MAVHPASAAIPVTASNAVRLFIPVPSRQAPQPRPAGVVMDSDESTEGAPRQRFWAGFLPGRARRVCRALAGLTLSWISACGCGRKAWSRPGAWPGAGLGAGPGAGDPDRTGDLPSTCSRTTTGRGACALLAAAVTVYLRPLPFGPLAALLAARRPRRLLAVTFVLPGRAQGPCCHPCLRLLAGLCSPRRGCAADLGELR